MTDGCSNCTTRVWFSTFRIFDSRRRADARASFWCTIALTCWAQERRPPRPLLRRNAVNPSPPQDSSVPTSTQTYFIGMIKEDGLRDRTRTSQVPGAASSARLMHRVSTSIRLVVHLFLPSHGHERARSFLPLPLVVCPFALPPPTSASERASSLTWTGSSIRLLTWHGYGFGWPCGWGMVWTS